MHFRRAILLFALVLGLAALAAAVSPSRDTSRPPVAPAPVAPGADATVRNVAFAVGGKRVRRAREGEHIVVSVASEAGGVATIPSLGRTADVSPTAPAQFDLLAPPPGRYDVMIAASGSAEQQLVGTLVTRP